jgi:endoribonuclease Dicer
MVPEFCFVHPLPCSVWKQVIWLPSILHRLNGLLVAEELRIRINKETKIGVEFLPGGVNVSTVWHPLTIRWKKLYPSKNDASTADPRLLLPTFKPQMLLDLDSEMLSDLDMIWNIDYSTDRNSDSQKSLVLNGSPRLSSASGQLDDSIDLISFVNDNPVNPPSNWNERTKNISFDIVSHNALSKFGPSPSLVLEALTLTKSNDGFDMERLETIGDSLLKLVIGIYVYGQTGSKHFDEGRLSHMRMQQINNKHLFKLGQQKNLGQLISGQSFDLILNFLPPGFQAPVTENAGETNLHLQQYVSTKNIADSMGISFHLRSKM